jgi:uncharacterized membrane protein
VTGISRSQAAYELRQRFWVIPFGGVLTGIVLSLLTVAIDRHTHTTGPPGFLGDASDARSLLQTIATSVVTLTSVVLTVSLVAVQLAMGQFSPRIVRALLQDRGDQLAIAVFGATFTFAIFSLRAVESGPPERVPETTVAVAIGLAIASGLALFLFVHHAGEQLRVGSMVDLVGNEVRRELDKRYRPAAPLRPDPSLVRSCEAGNVVQIDRDQLVAEATRAGCTLELIPVMGDFVIHGGPLFRIHGDGSRLDPDRLRSHVVLDDERTHSDDPAFGFRKLVDVAQRALGPSTNDATTAVQVINRLQDCLHTLAGREFPSGHVRDAGGELRLIERSIQWDGYVRLAFDEIRLAAGPYPQVTRRLRAALEDLKEVAPDDRQGALDRQLRLLVEEVERALDEEDARAALVPDAQGIGAGEDVATP